MVFNPATLTSAAPLITILPITSSDVKVVEIVVSFPHVEVPSVNPKTFAPRLISPLTFTIPFIATSALPETCNAAKALSGD
ncbi:MAG TPA: hypothetical protein LFV90_01520 [Rickettsia endosymbiont of Columbicola hoogstraali]|nr:hypothetical protein [Rickettsia endosymbiont of Columbicola hoogstraali]